jgi:ribosome recycling factor
MDDANLASVEHRMGRSLDALERDFERIRVGRASASLLARVTVEQAGGRVPLDRLATITVPDPRQIVIQPWDRSALRVIGAAIAQSGIGLTPTVDGPRIRLYVPPLSEQRRRELVDLVHKRMEQARVEIRDLRHEAIAVLRTHKQVGGIGADEAHRDIDRVQRLTDRANAEIDRLGRLKEASLLAL